MFKFGTGGWRAIIGDDFIHSNINLLAASLAKYIDECTEIKDKKALVIGYDRRFLSRKAAIWSAEVLAANGIKVLFIDEIAPTPLVMSAVGKYNLKFGMMITASHNPCDYNGIKILTKGGQDADKSETDRLEEIGRNLLADDVKALDFDEAVKEGSIELIDPFNEYIDTILESLNVEAIKKRRLKVLLDPMHGVSKTCLQTVLMSARCDVDVINDRTDPLFGGKLPAPSSDTLRKLSDMVVERGYDIGLATDGDADRLGIIDETGKFVHPNQILILLYYYLLEYKKEKGAVVRNIATTHILDKIALDHGEKCLEVPVGFKNISAGMEEVNALIGGESSGGLTIRGHIRGKDGIFAAGLIIELMSVTGKSLSQLLDEVYEKYGKMVMVERNYHFNPAEKERLYKILFEDRLVPEYGYPIERIKYNDGLKIYFKNGGWIIARFSGTEPVLRIFAEMENEDVSNATIDLMENFLK
ncbi:MAG: phosphoglucomutase/phosphomannomutase family protein [Lachnospiraceae bacterium]|nr:phosphoglucomutase/phosphomannomutase family protein [Lachnospiraceae bacterium]